MVLSSDSIEEKCIILKYEKKLYFNSYEKNVSGQDFNTQFHIFKSIHRKTNEEIIIINVMLS